MPEAYSISREFDFVRLDGLRRVTGRPPHEWDLYIVKELVDNALDADEVLWQEDPEQNPCVGIQMEYIKIPEPESQQLLVRVSNRAGFPFDQIEDIFATRWYTSRKAFIKGLTRGALGNALKTLLGIPYALRNRLAGDWSPNLKPMSILGDGTEYLPRYVVDSTAQSIQFEYDAGESRSTEGTVINIGVDHFEQERPRTLGQVELLGEQYHLCNPHADFHWTVEIDGEEWEGVYLAESDWSERFQGIAPVHWYSLAAFQDLLGALYRKRFGDAEHGRLPIETVCHCFINSECKDEEADLEQERVEIVAKALGQSGLTKADIEGKPSTQLYRTLYQHIPRLNSAVLGCIGSEHVREALTSSLPVEGEVIYERTSDIGDDPSTPFILEVAVARLEDGKRQIWTAINFTPTYEDPFLRRWLRAPLQADEPALGLRGLLDAYNMHEDTPIVLFLHLICPSIEHGEFSKTEINHLPFKQVLGDVLNRLLTTLRQAQEDQKLRVQQTVFQALEVILEQIGPDERFVFDQLLEKLRVHLSQDPELAAWLDGPDALGRLRTYVARYQNRDTALSHYLARPAMGTLSLPLHPGRHFSVSARHISRDLLVQRHVNKILYLQTRELESVVVENGWLCRMDMALLRNPPIPDGLENALVQCAASSDLPILTLHDADEASRVMTDRMRTWLEDRGMDGSRIVDLGLDAIGDPSGTRPTRLVEMMPSELATWMVGRIEVFGIPLKSMPSDIDIRRDIRVRVERLLLGHLWEGVSQQFEVATLLDSLDRELYLAETMREKALDEEIKAALAQVSRDDSYTDVLDKVVSGFFESFMAEHSVSVQELVQDHLTRVRNGWKQ